MAGNVNAHVHLEIAGPMTARGLGLPAWVAALRSGPPPSGETALTNALAVAATGTTAVVDIGNLGGGGKAMKAAGLAGLALHEVFGIDRPHGLDGVEDGTPHAPYSTHPGIVRAAGFSGRRWSIHLDEDPNERDFLRDGSGLWPDILRRFGRDLSGWSPPGLTPVRWLDSLGVLGPKALLVHCTLTQPDDLALVAERGASICICPRSNLHITGRLPDVPAMFAHGVRVLVGTDSLASCPDLDVRNEVEVLRDAFPGVSEARWQRCLRESAWEFLA